VGVAYSTAPWGKFPKGDSGDWCVALSSGYVKSHIYESLRRELGSLPPPHGRTSVTVQAADDFSFDFLELELTDSALLLRCIASKGLIRGDIRLTVSMGLGIDGTIVSSVEKVDVSLTGLAAVGDFFSSGAIRLAVESAVRSAFASMGRGSDGVTGFVATPLISDIAMLTMATAIPIMIVPTGLELNSHGCVVHGNLEIGHDEPPAVARPSAMPATAHGDVTLLAFGSWAPGSSIDAVEWDLGNGDLRISAGDDLSFVARKTFPSGVTDIQLRITPSGSAASSSDSRLRILI